MRLTIIIALLIFAFAACKKDKFTSSPQITFKEFKPNQGNNRDAISNQPHLVFEITDSEGDLDVDSSQIYVRNTFTDKLDSFHFPNLLSAKGKNFKGDVQVGLFTVMGGRNLPSTQRPYVDTIGFEVYVTDQAKHKSNVIVAQPFYYYTLP